jgi:hypothetical protein
MKALIQTGSSGRVPVPPEKRFLINGFSFMGVSPMQIPPKTPSRVNSGPIFSEDTGRHQ